jgi:leucyl aminopeptidase
MLTCFLGPEAASLPLHPVTPADLPALRERLAHGTAAFLDASGFTAKAQEVRLLPGPDGLAGAVVGLGAGSVSPWSFGGLPNALPAGSSWRLADDTHAAPATLGWALGAYAYTRFKPAARAPARLVQPPGTTAASDAAAAIWLARDLINAPANVLGPAELSDAVRVLAERHGARFTEVIGAALQEGFPAAATVGRGSARPPRVAILEWNTEARGADGAPLPLVALCGKGVCFDTGGLDLKPSAAMLRMKKDMGGAATLIGLADLVMRQRLPVRLLLLVGAVENSVGSDAFRPLDVIATRAGITVEIGNTDAEGRLVLADLLSFAAERNPELLIDCATLTGAARVALGPDLPALFASVDSLAGTVLACGRENHDPLWRLPLYDGYDSWIESSVADINNVATKPMAGAVVAALFLRRFVPPAIPWMHIDLYAWNDASRPGRPEGGEAQSLRALAAAIRLLFDRGAGSCG